MKEQLGDDLLPPERCGAELMKSECEFAKTLLWCMRMASENGMRSRKELVVEPLVSVHYADGQGVVTFAGVVLEREQREAFRTSVRWAEWIHCPGDNWDGCVRLGVPWLSIRERQIIHGKFGTPDWESGEVDLGFRLGKDVTAHNEFLGQYKTHHRRYPTFADSDVL